ncbi:MerR family transcriptional regulator [Bizionia gelidisalsuginis]|uniref:MerR family transcriptional regulator n=2 Tax=Bizionia TaxID=283785 RepID=A0A8H2LKC8_9FLAO|nr:MULTISPECIES: chaperone modulator CbpM [Bizionia]TYB71514.1 MerR family transcriptional regulator [Bizionia saleffrena]TYC10766.1 MerR family transcriptional regulator [Bizionia gelidisalsuginis]
MDTTHLISIQQFCKHYQVPITFISALQEYELVEITITETDQFIKTTQLNNVEKMMRLHYDLDINLEGIDAIYNLLQQVEKLQGEVLNLRNKLNTYE